MFRKPALQILKRQVAERGPKAPSHPPPLEEQRAVMQFSAQRRRVTLSEKAYKPRPPGITDPDEVLRAWGENFTITHPVHGAVNMSLDSMGCAAFGQLNVNDWVRMGPSSLAMDQNATKITYEGRKWTSMMSSELLPSDIDV